MSPLPPLKSGDLQRRRGDGDFERVVVVLGSERACLCGLRWGVRSLLRPLVVRWTSTGRPGLARCCRALMFAPAALLGAERRAPWPAATSSGGRRRPLCRCRRPPCLDSERSRSRSLGARERLRVRREYQLSPWRSRRPRRSSSSSSSRWLPWMSAGGGSASFLHQLPRSRLENDGRGRVARHVLEDQPQPTSPLQQVHSFPHLNSK